MRELVQKCFGNRFSKSFIELAHRIFTDDNIHFIDWFYNLYDFCTCRGHLDFYVRLMEHAEKLFHDDQWILRTAYAHQALILKAWSKLDKAMNLHKKEERICEELGDRAGLAIFWWNQGSLYGETSDLKKKIELWQKSIEMNESIGIQTEEDEKALKELME
jgi:tetratricopeptide (TPR) repeat protein